MRKVVESMSYAAMVMNNVKEYPELKIIDAHKLYQEKFNDVSEQAFYQTFSRMVKTGEIKRLTKGIYCIPKKGRFGDTVSSEKNILEHYLGSNHNRGVVVGYRMYNKYKLTTQVSKRVEIYSNMTLQENRHILNVFIRKANIRFDKPTIRLIELLEVLQNYKKIEDLNYASMIKFVEASIEFYDKKVLDKLVRVIGYKKSTLASLKNVLDYYGTENEIDEYLNGTSKYNALRMEELNEIAS